MRLTTRKLHGLRLGVRVRGCASRVEVAFNGRAVRDLTVPRGRSRVRVPLSAGPGTHRLALKLRPRGPCKRPARVTLFRTSSQESVPIGTAVWTRSLDGDPAFRALVAQNFGFVVPENDMKMDVLQPERAHFDFTHGDRIVDFARSHGLDIGMGHVLVWHRQLPGWLGLRDVDPPWHDQPGFPVVHPWTREELIEVMRRHITEVMRHYHGQVREWDVVNEALTGSGSWRQSIWYRVIGPEYIELAFRFARAADPQALLYYNDYGTEDVDHPKSESVYRLVKSLQGKGVPIDGVGFQYHLFPDSVEIPSLASMEANLHRFARLGLRLQITELDVTLPRSLRGTPQALEWQGRIYRRVARACRRVPACERFTTWGASDRYSWLSEGSDGLPFDAELQPKPAWTAITEVLRPRPEGF